MIVRVKEKIMLMVAFESQLVTENNVAAASENKRQRLGLYWMSFFWASSTLMLVSTLPMFLKDELKLQFIHVGLFEGLVVFLSFLT